MGRFIWGVVSVFVCVIIAAPVTAQAPADTAALHAKLVKTLGAAQGLSANFSTMQGKQTLTGSIKVKRGNKFTLTLPGRKITTNGVTVWNYTPATRSVVIGNYDGAQRQLNLESVFFTVLQTYSPAGLTRKVVSDGGRYDVLKLLPANPEKRTDDIASVEIYLKPGSEIIRKIGVKMDGQTMMYTLNNLKFHVSVSDAEFEFTPPKGVEVVDMR